MARGIVSLFPSNVSTFQMLAEFRWCHAGMVAEKMAEIKLARKIQMAGDILDGKPLVGQQQPGLVESRLLDVLVDRSLPGGLKQRSQSGVTDLRHRCQFLRFPIARRV